MRSIVIWKGLLKMKLEPAIMFNTPENWKELNKWIMAHSDAQERMHLMTAACMAWNLACKYMNDNADA